MEIKLFSYFRSNIICSACIRVHDLSVILFFQGDIIYVKMLPYLLQNGRDDLFIVLLIVLSVAILNVT